MSQRACLVIALHSIIRGSHFQQAGETSELVHNNTVFQRTWSHYFFKRQRVRSLVEASPSFIRVDITRFNTNLPRTLGILIEPAYEKQLHVHSEKKNLDK